MKVLFINNNGGGFADYINVPEGATVNTFFGDHMKECAPEDYLIRVNRQPVPKDCDLKEGDRISITPTKIEGAMSA